MPSVLLTDYKVLVLAVDEKYVAENFQQAMANTGEIPGPRQSQNRGFDLR